jgi:hypothetical protein
MLFCILWVDHQSGMVLLHFEVHWLGVDRLALHTSLVV